MGDSFVFPPGDGEAIPTRTMTTPVRLPHTNHPHTLAGAHMLICLRMHGRGETYKEAADAVSDHLQRETAALNNHLAGQPDAMASLLAVMAAARGPKHSADTTAATTTWTTTELQAMTGNR